MNFPCAIGGHMPYVDKYKHEQIKKVIAKARARHNSGPDELSMERMPKHINRPTHSMPILSQNMYTNHRPRFMSMPNSLNSTQNLKLDSKPSGNSEKSRGKNSFLSSIKKIFSNKKREGRPRSNSTGAIIHSDKAVTFRRVHSSSHHKKPADFELPPSRSPKRQRLRTISNKSGIMETIEEVNEIEHAISQEDFSSSEEDLPNLAEVYETIISVSSVNSAPGIYDIANLFYSCGNLSTCNDSSNYHSSNEIVCSA